MLAISKLSYVATFFPPNRTILLAENRAIQLVSRGPWNAIPAQALKALKTIGLPNQVRDLRTMAAATKVRVAAYTSRNVIAQYDYMADIHKYGDIVCEHIGPAPDHSLLTDTMASHITSEYYSFITSAHTGPPPEELRQARIYDSISQMSPPFDFVQLFLKKLSKFFTPGTYEFFVGHVIDMYKVIAPKS